MSSWSLAREKKKGARGIVMAEKEGGSDVGGGGTGGEKAQVRRELRE